jgi:hypothetical protein
MAHKERQLLDPEYIILCQWYDWIEQNFDIDLDLIGLYVIVYSLNSETVRFN